MMFNIGDKIVYPMHGAGVLEAIEENVVFGEKKRYFVLRIPVGNMRVLIPEENAEKAGIRGIISETEANNVLNEFKTCSAEINTNWNKRHRENLERIKSGNIFNVIKVVKSLMLREKTHGLSTGERKMLSTAKQIIVSELVIAKSMKQEKVESILEEIVKSELVI